MPAYNRFGNSYPQKGEYGRKLAYGQNDSSSVFSTITCRVGRVYSEGGCEAFLQDVLRTLEQVQQQSAESPDDRTLHSQNQSEQEKNTNESSK